jgi:hypothetical protein
MNMPVRKHPMPEIAAFVAELRHAVGDATIDDAVRPRQSGRADVLRKREWPDSGLKATRCREWLASRRQRSGPALLPRM